MLQERTDLDSDVGSPLAEPQLLPTGCGWLRSTQHEAQKLKLSSKPLLERRYLSSSFAETESEDGWTDILPRVP